MSLRHPEIARLWEEQRAAIARGEALIEGHSEAELGRCPIAGTWSAAQCLEHLSVTAEQYLTKLEPLLASTPRPDPPWDGEARSSWLGRMLRRVVDPANHGRAKAPKVFSPGELAMPDEFADRFRDLQARMLAAIEACDGHDLNRVKIASPASRLLRFRLGDVLAIVVLHNHRHLGQAERAVAGS